MSIAQKLIAATAVLAVTSGFALAQSAQIKAPATPAAPAAVTTPAAAAAAANKTVAAPTAPIAAKLNLNTASAEDLDKLPQIGAARSKAIVDARSKAKFKNWDDFVARKVVPSNAESAIKDLVTF